MLAFPESFPALPSAVSNKQGRERTSQTPSESLPPTPSSHGDSNCLSFLSDCLSGWLCWSYRHAPQGKPGLALMSGALRTAFWMRSHPLPWAPGPGHNWDHCAADKPAASRLSAPSPAPSPQRDRAPDKDDSEDNED